MELFLFSRFRAQRDSEDALREAILGVLEPTRAEPGCLGIHGFRSLRDPRSFFIHSHWKDEAAFEVHAGLPHTVAFIERVQALIDHPLDIHRTEQIG